MSAYRLYEDEADDSDAEPGCVQEQVKDHKVLFTEEAGSQKSEFDVVRRAYHPTDDDSSWDGPMPLLVERLDEGPAELYMTDWEHLSDKKLERVCKKIARNSHCQSMCTLARHLGY